MTLRMITPERGLYTQQTIAKLVNDLLADSQAGRTHALFIVDHDTLDNINASYGREAGDEVIEHTARVLPTVFRATDLVARTFDDEFIVLMKDISSLDTIECVAGLVLQLLRCPCGSDSGTLEATVTLGIAMTGESGPRTFNELFDNACKALRAAKRSKLHRFAIVDAQGSPIKGSYGFDRLVNASSPNMRPFLDTIDNGGVLLHAEPGKHLVPRYFSNSFLALLGGMSHEEALRVYGDDIVAGVHPNDRERVRDELAEALESGSSLRTIARLQAANDSFVWASISMTWTRGEDGCIDAFSAHTSVDQLMCPYDYMPGQDAPAQGAGRELYLFSVAFDQGKPISFRLFDGEHREMSAFVGADLASALIEGGMVHADSVQTLRDLCDGIAQGRRSDGALVLLRNPRSEALRWVRVSYQMVYDESGVPLAASGSVRDLPQASAAQGRFRRESKLFDVLGPRILSAFQVDVTANVVQKAHPDLPESVPAGFDACFNALVADRCYLDDAVDVARAFSRDSLLGAVSEGAQCLVREFRREDAGRIRWSSMTCHLLQDPETHHIMAFLYVSDIERRYVEVAFASSLVKPDPATGLFSRDALERIAAAVQNADASDNALCALAVVQVAMPADLRALLSAEDANRGQVCLGQQLALCLAQECLVAKMSAESFALFFPRVDSEGWLRQRVEWAIACLRQVYTDDQGRPQPIVVACGFSTCRVSDLRFGDALAQAQDACRINEAEPAGSVWSFAERVGASGAARNTLESNPGRSVEVLEGAAVRRPLLGAERAALDECMQALILSNDLAAGECGALRAIGRFYRARRVFSVALMESGVVTGLSEWHDAGAPPIIGQIVGRQLGEYSALQRAHAEGAPVVVRRASTALAGADALPGDEWRFMAFPVRRSGVIVGFICVEAPTLHTDSAVLLTEVVPLLVAMREKQEGATAGVVSRVRDVLTGLPNKAAFDRDTLTFDPTLFHSVGVIRLGLERSYTMDGERNSEAEDRSLLYAARNLSGLFPLDAVYRSGDMELACICTNISCDSFNARCHRMVAVMRQRERGRFAFCNAWSDAATPLTQLFAEAATSVFGDSDILFPDDAHSRVGVLPTTRRAFDGNAFSIRLQPQVDLRTGKVVGCEALARCSTPDGNAITPSEFVPRMEEEGTISDLDYFVFEQVLGVVEGWIAQGKEPVPVSMNFSRQTITESNFVASVLAIGSRYDVPEGLLTIEITESIGAFKNYELHKAMDVLHGQGFRFALDDLGSEYSTLSAMSELPFDAVKLDRLLVKRFADDTMSRSLVEGIAHACEKNGIRCIAEGVEQQSWVQPLVESGCMWGQGYYFARPMTVEQFTEEYL